MWYNLRHKQYRHKNQTCLRQVKHSLSIDKLIGFSLYCAKDRGKLIIYGIFRIEHVVYYGSL